MKITRQDVLFAIITSVVIRELIADPTTVIIHEIVTPLSTGYTCPVTIRDSSEARNTNRPRQLCLYLAA
jgi:hypothetical protein